MEQIPIGVSDYKELIEEGYYYLDKSLLIKEIFSYGKVILLPRPRGFGKTLNLSMLKYFFEVSEQSNEHLFERTAIAKYGEYKSLQGQYPVIFMTLKDIKGSSWELCYKHFAFTIYQAYSRHRYIIDQLYDEEKIFFERILQRSATQVELASSLYFLSKWLSRHYKKKVIVLIDDYDVPIQSAYEHGYNQLMRGFLRSLLTEVLDENPYIEKAILTGLTYAMTEIFSDLNNLEVFSITRPPFADKFGFTKEEVSKILNDFSLAKQKNNVSEWYDGYKFGEHAGMFNPWSMLKCIQNNGVLQMYWANTSDNILVKNLLAKASVSVKSALEDLLNNKSVTQVIEESITFPEINYRAELVWSLLLFTGYLTFNQVQIKEGKKYCSLLIPNEEIKFLYKKLLEDIFQESIVGGQVEELLRSLIEGDIYIFTTLLQSFVLNSMSAYGLPSNEPEKSYHLFVLGLLVSLSDSFEVKSNRESGLGRYDITLFPRKKSSPAIIIEFKIVRPGETKEKVAHAALKQIKEKKYLQEVSERGITQAILYGIAFEGKTIAVASDRSSI